MANEETKLNEAIMLDLNDTSDSREDRENGTWIELYNAYRTKKILTGKLAVVEETPSGNLAIVYFKDFRVVIPFSEMMIVLSEDSSYGDSDRRMSKIIGNMLGCELDFIIMGMDAKSRSIAASRREAMMKKRRIYYMTKGQNDTYKLNEGGIA